MASPTLASELRLVARPPQGSVESAAPKVAFPVHTEAEEALRETGGLAPWEVALEELSRLQKYPTTPEVAARREWLRTEIATAPLLTRAERERLPAEAQASLAASREPERAQACRAALSMASNPAERALLDGVVEAQLDGIGQYL
jgi:hypothetical protein